MNVNNVVSGTKNYINQLIDTTAESDFAISVIRPIVKMGINNNFYKIEKLLKLVADKDGNIDVDKLVDDTIGSVLNGRKGVLPVGDIATINIGDNCLTFIIPSLNKYFKFDSSDFIKFKNYLVETYGN